MWLIYTLAALLVFLIIFGNTNKEYFDPPPADIDANSCLGSAFEVKKMVLENQGQYEKKQRTFDKEKVKLESELKLGQNPPTSVFLGMNIPLPWNFGFTCNGRGNYIAGLSGWSTHHGSIGGPAGYGKRHYLLRGMMATCADGKRSPILGIPNGYPWFGSCEGGYNAFDLYLHANNKNPFAIISKCISGGRTASPLRPSDKYTRARTTVGYVCPTGTVLKGIWGRYGETIGDLKFQCAPVDYLPGNWKSVEDYYIAKGNPSPKKPVVPLNTLPCQYCMSKIKDDMSNDEKIKIAEDCAQQVIDFATAEAKKKYEEELQKQDILDAAAAAAGGVQGQKVEETTDVVALAKRESEKERSAANKRLMIGGGVSLVSVCFLIIIGAIVYFTMRKR